MVVIQVPGNVPLKVSGVFSDGYLIRNSGTTTLWLGVNSSVNAVQHDFTMPPNGTMNWNGKVELWALSSQPSVYGQIEIIYNANTAFNPSPPPSGVKTILDNVPLPAGSPAIYQPNLGDVSQFESFTIEVVGGGAHNLQPYSTNFEYLISLGNSNPYQFTDKHTFTMSESGFLIATIPNVGLALPTDANWPTFQTQLVIQAGSLVLGSLANGTVTMHGNMFAIPEAVDIRGYPTNYTYPAGCSVTEDTNDFRITDHISHTIVCAANTSMYAPLSAVRKGPAEISAMSVSFTGAGTVTTQLMTAESLLGLDYYTQSSGAQVVRTHVPFIAPGAQIGFKVTTTGTAVATIQLDISYQNF